MDNAVSRLSKPGIGLTDVLIFLAKRAQDGHFSLTDIWGVLTSGFIMKQVRPKELNWTHFILEIQKHGNVASHCRMPVN